MAIFVYPDAKTQTATNDNLAGIGVVPDIEVALSFDDLIKGIDTQLEAALHYLLTKRREARR